MKNKPASTALCKSNDKSLSKWEMAICEAKERIRALKLSIRTFQEMRDRGVDFPDPDTSESGEGTYESTSTFRANPAPARPRFRGFGVAQKVISSAGTEPPEVASGLNSGR
jgi:hypothetical protein